MIYVNNGQIITEEHRKIIWEEESGTIKPTYTGAKMGANRVTDVNVIGDPPEDNIKGTVAGLDYNTQNGAEKYDFTNEQHLAQN